MLKSLKADPIVVVTGYRAEELEAHLSDTGVCFVRNNRYRETEMFDSIKIGVKEIEAECERIMIFPIDVPAIRLSTIWKAMMADAPLCVQHVRENQDIQLSYKRIFSHFFGPVAERVDFGEQ